MCPSTYGISCQLISRRNRFLDGLFLVVLFTGLRFVEPSRDAQALSSKFIHLNCDLFDGMKGFAWLNLKHHPLAPGTAGRKDSIAKLYENTQSYSRRYRFARSGRGFWWIRAWYDRIEFECASPLLLPGLVDWDGHVEDIRYTSGANYVVVVE